MGGSEDDDRRRREDDRLRAAMLNPRAVCRCSGISPRRANLPPAPEDDGTWFLAAWCATTEPGRKISEIAKMHEGQEKDAALRRFWREEEQQEGYNAVTEDFLHAMVDRVMAWKRREIRH